MSMKLAACFGLVGLLCAAPFVAALAEVQLQALASLYDLGRRAEADAILFPVLEEYDRGGFEGRDASGRSNDWRMWDGTPMGYEGFLVDNYYTLLAVPLRQAK